MLYKIGKMYHGYLQAISQHNYRRFLLVDRAECSSKTAPKTTCCKLCKGRLKIVGDNRVICGYMHKVGAAIAKYAELKESDDIILPLVKYNEENELVHGSIPIHYLRAYLKEPTKREQWKVQ